MGNQEASTFIRWLMTTPDIVRSCLCRLLLRLPRSVEAKGCIGSCSCSPQPTYNIVRLERLGAGAGAAPSAWASQQQSVNRSTKVAYWQMGNLSKEATYRIGAFTRTYSGLGLQAKETKGLTLMYTRYYITYIRRKAPSRWFNPACLQCIQH